MAKKLSDKELKIILNKLKQIIGKEKQRINLEKDIEIENARIKNTTQGIAAYGAIPQNFVGMLTFTIAGDENRILPKNDLETIIKKTKIAYDSMLYFINKLRRFLNKKGLNLIYLASFELQKDGNLHSHIYLSIPLKAFYDVFLFYHDYKKSFIMPKQIKVGKQIKTIIPIGRSQLGISMNFMEKLRSVGYDFYPHDNPENPDRFDWRCTNIVSEAEFRTGNWPTLEFYKEEEMEKRYSEKITQYLMKNHSKAKVQKTVGSQFIKHNSKSFYNNNEWSEIQKKFIRKVCGKIYTASRLPISVSKYQKYRKQIMEIYPSYRNLNTLMTDYLNGKAKYENDILICPNGKSIKLK